MRMRVKLCVTLYVALEKRLLIHFVTNQYMPRFLAFSIGSSNLFLLPENLSLVAKTDGYLENICKTRQLYIDSIE